MFKNEKRVCAKVEKLSEFYNFDFTKWSHDGQFD